MSKKRITTAITLLVIAISLIFFVFKPKKDKIEIVSQTNEFGARKYLGKKIKQELLDSIMCGNASSYQFTVQESDTFLEIEREIPYCKSEFKNRDLYYYDSRKNYKELPNLHTNDKSQNIDSLNLTVSNLLPRTGTRLENIAMDNKNTWFNYYVQNLENRDPYLNYQFYNDTLVRVWVGY